MRRILAFVCIFILLLFTGMPMFTSNLLCNDSRVYADTPQISDNEKIRAAITVFLNSKGAYLSSQGLQMDAVMAAMQSMIDDFLIGGPIVAGEVYTQTKLLAEIGINTSPLTVILRAGAVIFFNQFLQWLIDEGKITNNQTNNNLYNGKIIGGSLLWIFDGNGTTPLQNGTFVESKQGDYFYYIYHSQNPNINKDLLGTPDVSNVPTTITYAADVVVNTNVARVRSVSTNTITYGLTEYLKLDNTTGLVYSTKKAYGGPAWYVDRNSPQNTYYYGVVFYNAIADKYYYSQIGSYVRNDVPSANIDFNKDDFDPTPTTPPSGSDGLTYQPRQNGTGNTYNNYNDYYYDWHEGDTYIYNPGSGGGGDDPGGGGENPTPGGTTPPWDGSDPGTPAGTLTPVEGGGYNFNLPDLGLPDLNIDWSINGLKEKFPFSIPWDLMAFFAVMNAEPETPYIKADIPLGLWEWNIDWDLHAFDNVARILRNMELIGFCIGLILITRSIIKG